VFECWDVGINSPSQYLKSVHKVQRPCVVECISEVRTTKEILHADLAGNTCSIILRIYPEGRIDPRPWGCHIRWNRRFRLLIGDGRRARCGPCRIHHVHEGCASFSCPFASPEPEQTEKDD